jgi:hypothetical protein
LFARLSHATATMAVLSRLTEASTPIHTGIVRSITNGLASGSTQASNQAISTKLDSVVTQRFSIIRRF